MKKSYRIFCFTLFLILAIFSSCTKSSQKLNEILEISGFVFEETIPLKYAKQLKIDAYNSAIFLVTVADSDRYLLLPKESSLPKNLPPEITIIRTPVTNAYLCASSAMALWSRLGSLDSIRFSAIQKKDWLVDEAKEAMEEGRILYAGKYNAPDFELLLKEKCTLSIESTMIYHTPQIKEKLEALGIPVFVDKSSYEENPLGRMEWIKLYGLMCEKFDVAEGFFQGQIAKIENRDYAKKASSQSELISALNSSKTVAFFYITSNGLVVIRGSEDYIVKMIEMAGGKYAFKNTRKSSSPSVTVSMEQFYAQCANADILIYNSSIDNTLASRKDLLEKSPLFADFKALQSGDIWMTGKYLYQATDRIGDMILDLRAIVSGEER
ncbi:MAG: ABC transporter substrate-binding protein, partial [Treponema sp.]|nr:ABC transporter substrate-binding protein [Treponema sp.]